MELVWSGYEPIRRTFDAVWIDGVVDDSHTWIDPISHPKDSCRLDTARFVKFFIQVYRIFKSLSVSLRRIFDGFFKFSGN